MSIAPYTHLNATFEMTRVVLHDGSDTFRFTSGDSQEPYAETPYQVNMITIKPDRVGSPISRVFPDKEVISYAAWTVFPPEPEIRLEGVVILDAKLEGEEIELLASGLAETLQDEKTKRVWGQLISIGEDGGPE